jgi:hypothetical protein
MKPGWVDPLEVGVKTMDRAEEHCAFLTPGKFESALHFALLCGLSRRRTLRLMQWSVIVLDAPSLPASNDGA